MRYSFVLWPHSNGRYEEAMRLPVQNELSLILSHTGVNAAVEGREVFGVYTLCFETDAPVKAEALCAHSHSFWVCEERNGAFVPLCGENVPAVGRDLPFVLKYKGKTNERFTRMLINLAICASDFSFGDRLTILDPMCGKGTTLFEALNRGWDACGCDLDKKSLQEAREYFKKYLEFHRIKHTCSSDSRTLPGGSAKSDVFALGKDGPKLQLACCDGSLCDRVFSKNRANIIACDLPYGVQHAPGNRKGFEETLDEMMESWKRALLPGGGMALSFNTFTLHRDRVRDIMRNHGFTVMEGGAWDGFAHWVEQAVNRDTAVCRR